MTGCHADHIEERCDKAAAHQSMVRSRLIEVECAGDWHDRFEMRRPLHGGFHLRSSKVTDADHPYIAVRPWLWRRPLHQVVHVPAFLTVKKAKGAAGTARTSAVRDDVHITARHEEVGRARFNKTCRRTKVLNLSRIRRSGNQYRISARFSWTVHVCQ